MMQLRNWPHTLETFQELHTLMNTMLAINHVLEVEGITLDTLDRIRDHVSEVARLSPRMQQLAPAILADIEMLQVVAARLAEADAHVIPSN